MKKKTTTITAFLMLLFLASCEVVDRLLTFNISNSVTFTINSGVPIDSPLDVPTPDVTTNSSTEFYNNNTSAVLVKDVKLQQLKLSITNPEDKTFSFLKSVHLYISTNADDEIELAFLDNISSTTNSISLICTTQKLDNYIKSSSYRIRTSITTKETLHQETSMKAGMKFKITADPFN